MTAQQLKNSILQLAVQGKLVPQDPDDEPASVLLERIRAEKQALIKQGKIKKDKKKSDVIKSEEVPFDIPDSWEWCRLGEIGETNIGLTYKPSDKTDANGVLVLRSSNIKNGEMCYIDNVYVSCDIPERARISKGDILICARNGSRSLVGKCAIVDKDGMAFGAFMAKYSSKFNQYIKIFIDSPVFRYQLDSVKTETINQITQDMLKQQLIPLPPLDEQKRIVAKIEEILPYIEQYEKAETQLTALNKNFPEMLKKSILHEAVQGKLVPQDPDDEPASVLLERIKAEKQKLIKQGKIKKDKKKSDVIKSEEVPFDIPESWEWVKICDLYSALNGDRGKNYPSKDKLSKNGIPFISAVNLDGKMVIEDDKLLCVSEEQYNLLNNGKLVKDDIVVCIRGSLGKHGKFQFNKGAIASSLVILRPYYNISVLSDFLMLYLDTPLFFSEIKKYDNGTAQPNLAAKSLEKFFIPLPPLEEQKRIVAKIEKLMKYCDIL